MHSPGWWRICDRCRRYVCESSPEPETPEKARPPPEKRRRRHATAIVRCVASSISCLSVVVFNCLTVHMRGADDVLQVRLPAAFYVCTSCSMFAPLLSSMSSFCISHSQPLDSPFNPSAYATSSTSRLVDLFHAFTRHLPFTIATFVPHLPDTAHAR